MRFFQRRKAKDKYFGYSPFPRDNIIAFVNTKSGGKKGQDVIRELRSLLNPENVFDITTIKPASVLYGRCSESLRIIAAGGDGTASLISSAIEEANTMHLHSIAVLPLGTGNDMAGFLNWGYKYKYKKGLQTFVDQVQKGEVLALDRWKINICSSVPLSNSLKPSDFPFTTFSNYFCIGGDAAIALKFHNLRNKNRYFLNAPGRFRNKLMYLYYFLRQALDVRGLFSSLNHSIEVECDGCDIHKSLKTIRPHTLLFLNIKSYGGGCKPWNNRSSKFREQKCDDGYLEVIGYKNIEFGAILLGAHGHNICQCKVLKLSTNTTLPVKIDGEPLLMKPATLQISLKDSVMCIRNFKK